MARWDRARLLMFLALAVACPLPFDRLQAKPPQSPSPLILPEHHRNPEARQVHTTYTCRDGRRSITLEYDHIPKGRVARLSRNGRKVPTAIVTRINELLRYLDSLSSVYPQCGSKDDIFIASGMKDDRRAAILIRWSLNEAVLGQIVE